MLHGYVGFIFGAIKANPWWSTPLMPVIFLLSAAVSGIALLILLYQVFAKLDRRPVVATCVSALASWLWFFLILTITLESLELIVMAYEKSESWLIISELLTTRLSFSYVTMQMIVGGLIPLILLAVVVLMNRYLHEKVRNTPGHRGRVPHAHPGLRDALEHRHRRAAPLQELPRLHDLQDGSSRRGKGC